MYNSSGVNPWSNSPSATSFLVNGSRDSYRVAFSRIRLARVFWQPHARRAGHKIATQAGNTRFMICREEKGWGFGLLSFAFQSYLGHFAIGEENKKLVRRKVGDTERGLRAAGHRARNAGPVPWRAR